MFKIVFVAALIILGYPSSNGYPKNYHYGSPQNTAYDDYRNFPVRIDEKVMGVEGYDQLRKAALEALLGMGFERIRKSEELPCEGKNKFSEPRCMVRRTLNSLVLGGSFKRADSKFQKTDELFEEDMDKGN